MPLFYSCNKYSEKIDIASLCSILKAKEKK